MAKQRNFYLPDDDSNAKTTNEMSEKLGGVFTNINSVRNEAQGAAEDIVNDFEDMKMFGKTKLSISGLVHSIFNNFNSVLDTAEQVGSSVVNKIGNSDIEISKSKRDLDEAVSNLKNQTTLLGKFIS